MALTDTAIRSAKPRATPYKLGDDGGLFLLVTPAGGKLWRMKFRYAGKEGKLSFGSYPAVSLKAARERREEARGQLAHGRNPAQEKRREEARATLSAASTYDAIAVEFIAKRRREGLSPATLSTYDLFRRLLEPSLGARPIAEIEPFELLAALQKIEKRGKLETATRCRNFAGRVFRFPNASSAKCRGFWHSDTAAIPIASAVSPDGANLCAAMLARR
jgi:hypothetical protein